MISASRPSEIVGEATATSAKLGLPLTVSPVWGGKAIDLCNGDDPICQTDGENVAAHRAYVGGPTNQAANFVAGLL